MDLLMEAQILKTPAEKQPRLACLLLLLAGEWVLPIVVAPSPFQQGSPASSSPRNPPALQHQSC